MAETRSTLKGYFNAGYEPTETNFASTIDGLASTRDANWMTGSMHLADTLHVTGSIRTSGGINAVSEALVAEASVTLTVAQAGKLLLIPDTATSNDEYVLPIPTFIGQTYNLCWSGIIADADDILIVAPSADAITFTGMLLDFDTDDATVAGYVMVKPGSDDDKLTMVNPESFDITFTATTLTNYHVRGFAMSTDTASAFGDL